MGSPPIPRMREVRVRAPPPAGRGDMSGTSPPPPEALEPPRIAPAPGAALERSCIHPPSVLEPRAAAAARPAVRSVYTPAVTPSTAAAAARCRGGASRKTARQTEAGSASSHRGARVRGRGRRGWSERSLKGQKEKGTGWVR
eukprot:scaffold34974_cov84-Isochrysis_galbana.AAC.1